nr:hypothetical protein CFP56_02879 [Quercus suber]
MLLAKVPEHLDECIWQSVKVDMKLAVCDTSVVRLVVMHHLDNLEQIILTQQRQSLGKLFHVDVATCFLALLVRLGCAVSCFAHGSGLLQALEKLRFRVTKRLVIPHQQRYHGRARIYGCSPTYHVVCALIPLLLEVEIMLDLNVSAFGRSHRGQHNRHVELSPSLLFDRERWGLEGLTRTLAERLVQDVGHFFEAVGRNFITGGCVDQVDGNVPTAQGEAIVIGSSFARSPVSQYASTRRGSASVTGCLVVRSLRDTLLRDELDERAGSSIIASGNDLCNGVFRAFPIRCWVLDGMGYMRIVVM